MTSRDAADDLEASLEFGLRALRTSQSIALAHAARKLPLQPLLLRVAAMAEHDAEVMASWMRGPARGEGLARMMVIKVWARLSARATAKFCVAMMAHMLAKESLVFQRCSMLAQQRGRAQVAQQCAEMAKQRQMLIDALHAAAG